MVSTRVTAPCIQFSEDVLHSQVNQLLVFEDGLAVLPPHGDVNPEAFVLFPFPPKTCERLTPKWPSEGCDAGDIKCTMQGGSGSAPDHTWLASGRMTMPC